MQVLPDLHRVDVAATAAASNLDPAAPGQRPSVGPASRTDKRNFASLHLKILLLMARNRLSLAPPADAKDRVLFLSPQLRFKRQTRQDTADQRPRLDSNQRPSD